MSVFVSMSEPAEGSFSADQRASLAKNQFSGRSTTINCGDSVSSIEIALSSGLGGNFVVTELASSMSSRSLAVAFVEDAGGAAAA